jgi:hypothetical protein
MDSLLLSYLGPKKSEENSDRISEEVASDDSSKLSPLHGVDVKFGSFVAQNLVYGPWGDHQRAIIQEFFFPKTYEDNVELYRSPLRTHDTFDVRIQFLEETTWILPFIRTPQTLKEKSENKGFQQVLSCTVGKDSNIFWRTSMGAQSELGSITNIYFNINELVMKTSNTNAALANIKQAKVCNFLYFF